MQYLGARLHERFTAQTARFVAVRVRFDGVRSRDGGVAHDDSVDLFALHHARDILQRGVGEIGRNFHQHRRLRRRRIFVARVQNLAQQPAQMLATLQVSQTRRVRRGNIHDDVIAEFADVLHPQDVIIRRAFLRRDFILPEIHAEHASRPLNRVVALARAVALAPARQSRSRALVPEAVESVPIDHRPVFAQSKRARLRVPRLRQRRHAPDLHEPESHSHQRLVRSRVLIESRRQSDRVVESHPERVDGERRRVASPPSRSESQRERRDADVVRRLRVQRSQRGRRESAQRELDVFRPSRARRSRRRDRGGDAERGRRERRRSAISRIRARAPRRRRERAPAKRETRERDRARRRAPSGVHAARRARARRRSIDAMCDARDNATRLEVRPRRRDARRRRDDAREARRARDPSARRRLAREPRARRVGDAIDAKDYPSVDVDGATTLERPRATTTRARGLTRARRGGEKTQARDGEA